MRKTVLRSFLALGAAFVPAIAEAHVGVGAAHGFAHGLGHPFSGLDHVLAMTLVGVLAVQLGGRAIWMVPAAFVSVMMAGGALGAAAVNIPFVETGIALSVIVLGAMVAFDVKASAAAAAAIAGLFALFHGHAHGAEMPATASGLIYGAGFVLATVALHAIGVSLGFGLHRLAETKARFLTRSAGGVAALLGVLVLAGAA